MQSKKRRQICDERSIPAKYKKRIGDTTCIYLHQVKIVDGNGRLRHLLELDKAWKEGSFSQPPTNLTLRGTLVPPDQTNSLAHGIKFQTSRIVDLSFDFAGFIWAVGEGPKHEDYYYLILSPEKEYEPYFYRLLRFKYLVLHLNALCDQQDNAPSTIQQALERKSDWQAEGGLLSDQEIAQDAALACKLLKESFPTDHPIILDLERLSAPNQEASTEDESQTNENEAKSSFEEVPMDASMEERAPDIQVPCEIPQVNEEEKDTNAMMSQHPIARVCQMEGCSCYARDTSKYCSDECGLLKAFLTLRRLQYC